MLVYLTTFSITKMIFRDMLRWSVTTVYYKMWKKAAATRFKDLLWHLFEGIQLTSKSLSFTRSSNWYLKTGSQQQKTQLLFTTHNYCSQNTITVHKTQSLFTKKLLFKKHNHGSQNTIPVHKTQSLFTKKLLFTEHNHGSQNTITVHKTQSLFTKHNYCSQNTITVHKTQLLFTKHNHGSQNTITVRKTQLLFTKHIYCSPHHVVRQNVCWRVEFENENSAPIWNALMLLKCLHYGSSKSIMFTNSFSK
jgi:hypothetical protein